MIISNEIKIWQKRRVKNTDHFKASDSHSINEKPFILQIKQVE